MAKLHPKEAALKPTAVTTDFDHGDGCPCDECAPRHRFTRGADCPRCGSARWGAYGRRDGGYSGSCASCHLRAPVADGKPTATRQFLEGED